MVRRSRSALKAGFISMAVVSAAVMPIAASAADGGPQPPKTIAGSSDPRPAAEYAPDRVIVGFQPETVTSLIAGLRTSFGVTSQRLLSTYRGRAEVWQLAPGMPVLEAVAELQKLGIVRYAEPDWKVETLATSNDPSYVSGDLWGMYGDATSPANQFGSQAGEAWAGGSTGSSDVYVGIIDEGIDYGHPDLDGNVWTNPYETPSNGIDDDGNGYVDDVHGWDFVYDDASVHDAGDDLHGTHVAGTIGAEGGNGIGVAGVNWDVTMISAKAFSYFSGWDSDIIDAINYITDLKVRHGLNIVATSNSWGGGEFSQAMLDAIDNGGDHGILFIAAAGNDGYDNDSYPSYPASYECTDDGARGWDCIVAVAAIQDDGELAYFSQYGETSVDLGAPGVHVLSTQPGSAYEFFDGTSMATPHVTGAVALCASINPALTPDELRLALLASTAATPSLTGITATGGRLDVGAMAGACAPSTEAVTGTPSSLAAVSEGPRTVALTWTDTSSNETSFELQRAAGPGGSCAGWTTVARYPRNATSATMGGLTPETDYCFRIRARNTYGGGTTTAWSNEAAAQTDPPPPPYVCSEAPYAWVDLVRSSDLAFDNPDDAGVDVTAPFPVSFYGATYETMTVSTNGYVVLGTGSGWPFENVSLPNRAQPNGMVAAFWTDLWVGSGRVATRTIGVAPNRTFVVGWIDVYGLGSRGSGSFEILFEEATGAIRLQYADVFFGSSYYNRGASATVGLENVEGYEGTTVSHRAATLAAGRAYRCSDHVGVQVTTSTLPPAVAGVAYSSALAAADGAEPYSWSVTSGTLPPGLALSATGTISGTPTQAGAWTFTAEVTDAAGSPTSDTRELTLAVAPTKRSPANRTTLQRGATSALLQWYGHVAATEYRYCVALSPGSCTSWISAGTSTSATASGLLPRQTYYWQVQALVSGTWVSFDGGVAWYFKTRR